MKNNNQMTGRKKEMLNYLVQNIAKNIDPKYFEKQITEMQISVLPPELLYIDNQFRENQKTAQQDFNDVKKYLIKDIPNMQFEKFDFLYEEYLYELQKIYASLNKLISGLSVNLFTKQFNNTEAESKKLEENSKIGYYTKLAVYNKKSTQEEKDYILQTYKENLPTLNSGLLLHWAKDINNFFIQEDDSFENIFNVYYNKNGEFKTEEEKEEAAKKTRKNG